METQELTVSERITPAEKLWDSILNEESEIKLTKTQEVELNKRLDAFMDDRNLGSSWSNVKERIITNK